MDRTRRFSILAGGISIGSVNVTAGTLSGIFKDMVDGENVLVSNYHVFQPGGKGNEILQPGPYDGGSLPSDRVGRIKRYVPLQPSPLKVIICTLFGPLLGEWCSSYKNLVDAAAAKFDPADPTRSISKGVYMDDGSILIPKGTHPGDGIIGRKVWKVGRTTGYTEGVVVSDSAVVRVWYGDKYIVFQDQIIVKGQSRGGDSGSPVFLMSKDKPSEDDQLVGLLFAGSDEYFIVCKYKHIQNLLKVNWQPI